MQWNCGRQGRKGEWREERGVESEEIRKQRKCDGGLGRDGRRRKEARKEWRGERIRGRGEDSGWSEREVRKGIPDRRKNGRFSLRKGMGA